jgi:hypothetical protein
MTINLFSSISRIGLENASASSSTISHRRFGFLLFGLLKLSGIVTLLGVGAAAAGATMLLRSQQNKNNGVSNFNLESGAAVDGRRFDTGNGTEKVDGVTAETLIATDDSELSAARGASGETF